MNILTQKISKAIVLDKDTNKVVAIIDSRFASGSDVVIGNYQDYLNAPDSDKENVFLFEENVFCRVSFEVTEVIPVENTTRVQELKEQGIKLLYRTDYLEFGNHSFLSGNTIIYLRDDRFNYVIYNEGDVIKGIPHIGSVYHTDLNAFVFPPERDDYVLNETTYEYEPDPEKSYDLHNDGKLYKYDAEGLRWIPIN